MIQEWDVADVAPSSIDRNTRLDATREVESSGNPLAVSKAGAQGAYQFMPATARQYGVTDPFNEEQSRAGANRYLSKLEKRYGGSAELAHLAYNWGEGNVNAWLKTGKGLKGDPMPKEAQQYVGKIMSAANRQPAATAGKPQEWSDADVVAQSKQSALPKATSKKSITRQASEMALEGLPWYEKALIGAGKTVSDIGKTFGLIDKQSGDDERDRVLLEDSAALAGNITGEIAATAVPGGAAFKVASKAVPFANKAGKVLKLAAGGAGAGAVSEGMLGRDVGEGAAFGAAISPAIAGVGKLGKAGIDEYLRLKGGSTGRAVEELRDMFGSRLPQAVRSLRGTQAIVPGERPTAGMAASAHLPELSVLEAGARSRPQAHLFTQADESTEAARRMAVAPIADPAARRIDPATGKLLPTPAEEGRTAITKPYYDAAERESVALSPEIQRLMLAPELRGPLAAMENQFRTLTRSRQADGLPGPVKPHRGAKDPYYGQMGVEQLQMLVRNLDEAIRVSPDKYNLIQARRQLKEALDQSGNYKTASGLFAEASKPVNQSEVAHQLMQNIDNPDAYVKALREGSNLFKKADLSPRFQTMEEVFQNAPQDLNALRQVEQSMMREQAAKSLPTEKGIVPKFLSPAEKVEQQIPHLMTRAVTVLRSVLKTIGRRSDEDVQKVIDEAMVNPQKMADLIESVPPTERGTVAQAMKQMMDNEKILQYGTAPAVGQMQQDR